MLQQIFYVFVMIVVLMFAVTFIESGLPGWRFNESAEMIIGLYEDFQEKMKKVRTEGEKIKISYLYYEMEFDNEYEAWLKFKNMIDVAFIFYDELGWIQDYDEDGFFKTKKDKLESIYYEIRLSIWKSKE